MEPQDRTGRTEISGGQLPTLPQPHHTSAPAGLEGIHSRGDPQPATQPSLSRETGKEEHSRGEGDEPALQAPPVPPQCSSDRSMLASFMGLLPCTTAQRPPPVVWLLPADR